MSETRQAKKRFPWVQFTIWLALFAIGDFLVFAAKPNLLWFDIAWPVAILFGVIYFIKKARQ